MIGIARATNDGNSVNGISDAIKKSFSRKSIYGLLTSLYFILLIFHLTSPNSYAGAIKYFYDDSQKTVVGIIQYYVVKKGDTLLDIARKFGLGYNDVSLVYPNTDPWIPPPGKKLVIPTMWVLPESKHNGIILNIPELRLYYFKPREHTVQTYPVGIGDEGWETPVGHYRIGQKRKNPTWYIPRSLQEKYGKKSIPPGPENPLGSYIMKLAATSYGIHGTNMPWGVGRLVSHGCIRLYPEHIEALFHQVKIGTPVEIVYEPIKWGRKQNRIFVEIHPDVYRKIEDFNQYALLKLENCPFGKNKVDYERYMIAVRLKNGVPVDVTNYNDP